MTTNYRIEEEFKNYHNYAVIYLVNMEHITITSCRGFFQYQNEDISIKPKDLEVGKFYNCYYHWRPNAEQPAIYKKAKVKLLWIGLIYFYVLIINIQYF
jgi:hypothetical protein